MSSILTGVSGAVRATAAGMASKAVKEIGIGKLYRMLKESDSNWS